VKVLSSDGVLRAAEKRVLLVRVKAEDRRYEVLAG
jgi:hypothetical protein